MRRRLIAAPLAVLAASAGFAACEPTPVSGIGLSMVVPQGVLDDANSLTLYVFPAEGRTCEADGSASELPGDALSFQLSKSGCTGGATWCGEIVLEQGDEAQMFHVQASDESGLLAQGCTTAVVDRDPLDVNIEVVRFVVPACCGDGIVQPGELCDNGGDDTCGGTTADQVCASDCTTRPTWVDDFGDPPEDIGQGELSIAFTAGGRAARRRPAGRVDLRRRGRRDPHAPVGPAADRRPGARGAVHRSSRVFPLQRDRSADLEGADQPEHRQPGQRRGDRLPLGGGAGAAVRRARAVAQQRRLLGPARVADRQRRVRERRRHRRRDGPGR
jgi:hypothetical protein